jgi:DNA-binding transcriptional ArsR family regulator
MRTTAEADVFAAIAHPARRAMLSALLRGERSAGELAEPFEMTFGAVSQHLKVLEEAELVVARGAEYPQWRGHADHGGG